MNTRTKRLDRLDVLIARFELLCDIYASRLRTHDKRHLIVQHVHNLCKKVQTQVNALTKELHGV